MTDRQEPRVRWWQFSIRTLMVLAAMVGDFFWGGDASRWTESSVHKSNLRLT